jgi:hypothetical protein
LRKHQVLWPDDADKIPLHSKKEYQELLAKAQGGET